MEKNRKSRGLEVRISLLSVVLLFGCWIVVCLAAFYLGVLFGRNDQIESARQRVPILEPVGEAGSPTVFSFPDVLPGTEPSPLEELPPYKEMKPAETAPARAPVAPKESSGLVSPAPVEGTVLQVGAFKALDGAQQTVRNLKAKGYPCFFETSTDANSGKPYYRVLVGPFPTLQGAEAARGKLEKEEKLKGIMVRSLTPP